jgi:small-conductance mechanosensitive channel
MRNPIGSPAFASGIAKPLLLDLRPEEWRELVTAVVLIVGTIAVAVLLVVFTKRLRAKLEVKAQAWVGARFGGWRIQQVDVLTPEGAQRLVSWLVRGGLYALLTVLLFLLVPFILSVHPGTQTLAHEILGYILEPIRNFLRALRDYLPNLLNILVVLFSVYWLLRAVSWAFDHLDAGRFTWPGFHAEWAKPTYNIVRFLILVLTFIIIFPFLPGSESPAFQGVSVFFGILISLGSSSAIGNIISGIVITYMRPFRLGDFVEINGFVGTVVEKNLLVTRICTNKQVDITLPNALVLGQAIRNYSRQAQEGQGVIFHTTITIGYDIPWTHVNAMMLEAARRTAFVAQKPKPFVLQTALNDFHISYELNFYVLEPHRQPQILSEIHSNLQTTFQEAGVEILSPGYHAVRSGEASTVPPASQPAPAPEAETQTDTQPSGPPATSPHQGQTAANIPV